MVPALTGRFSPPRCSAMLFGDVGLRAGSPVGPVMTACSTQTKCSTPCRRRCLQGTQTCCLPLFTATQDENWLPDSQPAPAVLWVPQRYHKKQEQRASIVWFTERAQICGRPTLPNAGSDASRSIYSGVPRQDGPHSAATSATPASKVAPYTFCASAMASLASAAGSRHRRLKH